MTTLNRLFKIEIETGKSQSLKHVKEPVIKTCKNNYKKKKNLKAGVSRKEP